MLGWILCKLKGHVYRKARKGENAEMSYCARCPQKRQIKHRRKHGQLVASPTTGGRAT